MADLGTISTRGITYTRRYVFLSALYGPRLLAPTRRPTSFWRGGYSSPIELLNFDVSGTISGDTVEDGVPVRRWIRLHHRTTGTLIMAMYSDATTGAFSFSGLDKSDLYYAVKLDNIAVSPDFNAEIFDRLTPV